MGVVEGDTTAQVFVNSVYMSPDRFSLPVLPMNGVRRFPVLTASVEVVPIRGRISDGDTLAIMVKSERPAMVNWTDPRGKTLLYPGLAGVAASFDDGTTTTGAWKCAEETWDTEDLPWHSPIYNDTAWVQAEEQAADCCPWRDQEGMWDNLAVRWIGVQSSNVSGPRTFYCRYRVPGPGMPRLPAFLTARADEDAPKVHMVRFLASSSQVQVSFTLDRAAIVSCNAIDSRYKLRPPTALELQQEGVTSGVLAPNGTVWRQLGPYFTARDYDTVAISYHSVSTLPQCEAICDSDPLCHGITFYEAGVHLETGSNCKLVTGFDLNTSLPLSDLHRFTHKYTEPVQTLHVISLTGMLLPGTIYDAYCSSQDPVTGNHSTWDIIAQRQHLSNRTAGCLDCGATDPPNVTVRGGWAGDQELTAVISSTKAGRIFCRALPVPVSASAFTPDNIKAGYNANFLTQAGSTVPVTMTGLSPLTEYEMGCFADSDGGIESSAENIEASRRRWFTESVSPPIMGMSIQTQVQDNMLTLSVFVQMGALGLLWCREMASNETRLLGVPQASWLRTQGVLTRVEDLAQETPGSFPGLDPNRTYEVYCAAEETAPSNTSAPGGDGAELTSPFPVLTVLSVTANYDVIRVMARVDRGPSTAFCLAKLWSYTTQKEPAPPIQAEMIASPSSVDVPHTYGATVVLEIIVPYIGSFYDIYCYSEEFMELPPPGAELPARRGMDEDAIRKTRRTVQTVGATHKNNGWLCVTGFPCNVTDERGPPKLPLLGTHRILVRDTPCPGHCYCTGEEDAYRKGAFCSPVSHDPRVAAPFRVRPDDVEVEDPKGRWCYVRPGVCSDQERSPTVPSLWISYFACAFNLTAGREGSGPVGFPSEGLARPAGTTGRVFSWGSMEVLAKGAAYYLCWCDSLTSPCKLEVDFRLSLGRLHISGPSSEQAATVSECIAGRPCLLRRFDGHALEDGSRLVALNDTSAGCLWQKQYPLDPPGIVGFPLDGVSLPATDTGSTYSWGDSPVLASGGHYILCWCGAARLHPGMGGGMSCPSVRPEDGQGFLKPAGFLTVVGPIPRTTAMHCSLGLVCEVDGIQGVGIRGGDRAFVTSAACGLPSPPVEGWATGIGEMEAAGTAEGWLDGGWLRYGPVLSGCVLRSVGAPVATTCYNTTGNVHEGPPDFNTTNASSLMRGLLGLPNGGMSETSTTPGRYSWNAPSWAFAGDYRLCWCADLAPACNRPEHFNVFIGTLRFEGPAVLPLVSQLHICVRGKTCTITGFRGRMPFDSQLFISAGECGAPAPPGAPNGGVSLPSLDSTTYSWGSDRIMAAPGKYRLCWCSKVGFCHSPEAFGAYSGMLQVKGLLGDNLYIFCTLGQPCHVGGIQGEGLQDGDEIRVLTVCGHGQTPLGFEGDGKAVAYDQGTRIVVPPTRLPGRFSLCWCPAGDADSDVSVLCSRPEDYQLFLGMIEVGGPEPGSHYTCYEWQPCSIPRLQGTVLHAGDRLLVAAAGTDCATEGALPPRPLLASFGSIWPPPGHPNGRRRRFPHAIPEYREFPQLGVTSPATGDGFEYSWGAEVVRTPPGIYSLCWCNHAQVPGGCTERGPFLVPAGSIRIATVAEHAYLNRPPDPAERELDQLYGIALAIPFPLMFFLAIVAGRRRLSARQASSESEANVWKGKPSLARIAQAKAKQLHEVKQVKGTRLRADAQGLRAAGIGFAGSSDDLPNFMPVRDLSLSVTCSTATGSQLRGVPPPDSGLEGRLETPALTNWPEAKTEMALVPLSPDNARRDPRGAVSIWEEPSEVPPPPRRVVANFNEYKRHAAVREALNGR